MFFCLHEVYLPSWSLTTHISPQVITKSFFLCRFKLKLVYMYAAGFYTYSIFALQFWEIKRSDFGISMVHHVVSVILIALSYIFRYISYL
jgi:hypothetical protein